MPYPLRNVRLNPDLLHQLLGCLDEAATGIGLFDPGDRLRYANRYFRQAYDLAADSTPTWEEMMRHCHRERVGLLIESEDIESWMARVRLKRRQSPKRCFESDLADGRWMRVTETLHPDGWLLAITADVTALKVNESTLREARDEALRLSVTDALTGLHNRRHVFERLDELFLSARQLRYPLAVAVIDLDHFKDVNDAHGHGVGDQVLVHFARVLRQALRPQDLVGRIGGEEFLLALPNTEPQGVHQVLRRLRGILTAQPPVAALPQLRTTFSSGVAHALPDDNVHTLWTRADRALYRAKAAGRGVDLDDDTVTGFAV
jgi:diguanylate cyclase (GGDEF)-like protein|uniref:sensor domain-containing diguanylate cyclase n=1 Tax=Hylemonella sp. TaxID=2066020 RepID=UPI0035B33F61